MYLLFTKFYNPAYFPVQVTEQNQLLRRINKLILYFTVLISIKFSK
jgi:hypothetical protein